jgi:hypothetical protein
MSRTRCDVLPQLSISVGPILIRSRALVSVMPPDEAARGCAEHAMVTAIVTRYTADNSSLKAPFRRSGR